MHRLTEPKWEERRRPGLRNDGGRIGRDAQHPTEWVASRISLRISIFLFWDIDSRHVLSPHIIGAWRRSREDSSRGWPLYAQVLARDLTTELAEPSLERSALRIGSGGNTDIEMRVSRKTEIRENLRGGRRKRCDRALECIDDTARAIRGSCRALHQLGAIRPLCGDSDTACFRKDQGSALVLWRAKVTQCRTKRAKIEKTREHEVYGRTTEVRRSSQNYL